MLVIALQLVAGWFVADLITALVHLTLDKLHGTRCQRWPLVGQMIVEFREHHAEPLLMPRRGFWESSKETVVASLLGIGFACLGWPCFWLTVALGTGLCQEVHKYAHRLQIPGWVYWLQRCRLLMRPEQHAGHHNGVFDRNFGILNGWSNPLVNYVLGSLGL